MRRDTSGNNSKKVLIVIILINLKLPECDRTVFYTRVHRSPFVTMLIRRWRWSALDSVLWINRILNCGLIIIRPGFWNAKQYAKAAKIMLLFRCCVKKYTVMEVAIRAAREREAKLEGKMRIFVDHFYYYYASY